MGDIILAGKFAISIVCVAASIILIRHPKPFAVTNRVFDRSCLLLLAFSRIGLFIFLFFILDQSVTSDVAQYYYPQGLLVLDGAIVYRDFESSYSPLFSYLVAGILLIWNSAKAIVASAIVIELISLPIWLSVARHHFSENVTRTAAMLYVTSPIPLLNVAMNGHNQVWISLLLAISLWLLTRKVFLSGLVFGFALTGVKLLGLLYAPLIWLFSPRRSRWLAGYALLPALVFGTCYALVGNDLLYPLIRQGVDVTGGNLFYFCSLFGLDIENQWLVHTSTVVTLLALATIFLAAWLKDMRRHPSNVIHLLSVILFAVFLFSKKAYASYFALSFFTICLSLAGDRMSLRALLLFGLFGLLAALEPSLFFRWMQQHQLGVVWAATLPEGLVRTKVVVFVLCDLILIMFYIAYFILIWKRLRLEDEAPDAEAG